MPYNENMRERDIFSTELYPHFIKNSKIYVLFGDVGCAGLDKFKGHRRCINVGIAEQNMLAVATGLAVNGNRVYCFTIQAFYLRAIEHIKVLINDMQLPIFMLGCGKDKYYKDDGITHWAIEDTAIISQFKNIKIWNGGDISSLVKETLKAKNPFYIRMKD